MRVEELAKFNIPEEFIEKFKQEKIFKLYPPQADVVRKKLLKDRNLVISLPTAGGKTLIATLAMIYKLADTSSKVVYIVPLVALGYEKFSYYQKFFEGSYKVALSVGDFDSSDPWLANYDIIIATSEKLDSLLRHGAEWINQVGLIIVDEIHLLTDYSRGPTLEILLTRLRETVPRAQILALSATIKNSKELADWLNATLLLSDFRPIELHEGVLYNSKVEFYGKAGYELEKIESEEAILKNTLEMKKQCLYFVSTRKNAEILAERLAAINKKFLTKSEAAELAKLSEKILNVLEIPTHQCKKLAAAVNCGVAFHHAGLLAQQKRLIEENFRAGLLKAIVTTPTLALGVNLPAFRVIIRDAKRYVAGQGSTFIPVLEYKQMVGRAGRPQYDSFGESILIARDTNEARELVDRYILGEPEEIRSKLAVEPVLRMHTLAMIASGFIRTEKELKEFFSKTFYAFQYGSIDVIEDKIEELLERFVEWKFITKKESKIAATRIGKRVSELYIDPLTAHNFINALENSREKSMTAFSCLQTICNTIEMQPLLSVRTGEFAEIENIILQRQNQFLQAIPEEWDLDFDDFFKSVKTALMFEDWINEATEEQLFVRFRIAPGELRSRLEIADWLIYALHELALLLNFKNAMKEIRKLRIRLYYGVKEELLPLVKLEQIGRIRARKLFNANQRSLEDLRKIPLESLARIVGPKVAVAIKNQLEGKRTKEEKQTTLA
jgi:helicase